jgi:hypothetical protein
VPISLVAQAHDHLVGQSASAPPQMPPYQVIVVASSSTGVDSARSSRRYVACVRFAVILA